jgi:hypothetical protein
VVRRVAKSPQVVATVSSFDRLRELLGDAGLKQRAAAAASSLAGTCHAFPLSGIHSYEREKERVTSLVVGRQSKC